MRLAARAVPVMIVALAALSSSAAAAQVKRIYTSPDYHWNHKLPKVAPVIPGKLIKLGDGADPRVLVDAAGTGQIAYTTQPLPGPSLLHDCVLLRGQTGCVSNGALVPPEDGDPSYNLDDAGPTPLAIGNELLMIDHRYPNPETLPDGTAGYPTFLWTSEDGGKTFTGPGVIGNLEASGNAVVFGGNQPQIGIISDTMTGGTFFQTTPPGAYTSERLNLGDQGPDEAYDGRLALDGNNPIAEFQDLSDHIFIREYSGSGDIFSTADWSVAKINGEGYSRLVSGPSGVWLLYQKTYSGPLFVLKIVHGQPFGNAVQVTPNSDFWHANYAINEDSTGQLTVGWFNSSANSELYVRTSSPNGSSWSPPQLIAKSLGGTPSNLSLGEAGDGGGFAAFQVPEPGGASGSQVDVAAFGSFVSTGVQGLGNLDGDGIGSIGGDPLGSVSCTDVHFGDIDAIAEAGCFLRDPKNPTSGAAIIQGEIRLNGLEIIPDAGVEIVIDPRQHTINTTGDVRVVLRAPVIGDIQLYHGTLDISLSGDLADAGQTLFDFNTATASGLEGFPFDTSIEVQIQHDSVVIPVSLKLPPYMGSVTGAATLLANNADGLELKSLHIGVGDLVLGALEIKDLNIDYTQTGDVWTGSAMLNIPAGSPYFGIAVSVRFDKGDFDQGSFQVTVPYPGVPIFTDTYLDGFGGGFDIHPDSRSFEGTIMVGAIPLDPPNYGISVTGTVTITFINNGPVVLEVTGTGAVHGLQLATAKLLFQTNGYFEVDGNIDVDLDVAELQASVKALADLPAKEFSAEINGSLSVLGYGTFGISGIVSSKGVAACGTVLGATFGLHYAWGDTPGAGFGCDVSDYEVQPVSAVATSGLHPARVATVATASSSAFEDLAVAGTGAPPSVVLHGPGGQTVVPVILSSASSPTSPALALPDASNDTTYVMIPKPGSGTWSVAAAPGSSVITAVSSATGYADPKVQAHVVVRKGKHTLAYKISSQPGLTVSFAERAKNEYRQLGTARNTHGTLRFKPGVGQAGKRTVYALISVDGVPRETMKVASYRAPGPVIPSRVRGLSVRHRGHRFIASFKSAAGADYYVATIVGSDGRHLVKVLRGPHHTLNLPVIGYKDHLSVQVIGVSLLGRKGSAVSARV
jgi:hypothetical protein